MKTIIVILLCVLLLAAGVPLFAHGPGSDHGRFHKDNPHRWQGSSTHPAFHGWHGWGFAPRRCRDGVPGGDPTGDPPDHPGTTPVGQPGDKPDKPDPQQPTGDLQQVLDLAKGSVIG
jgi:hypothetical protein